MTVQNAIKYQTSLNKDLKGVNDLLKETFFQLFGPLAETDSPKTDSADKPPLFIEFSRSQSDTQALVSETGLWVGRFREMLIGNPDGSKSPALKTVGARIMPEGAIADAARRTL